MGRDTMLGHKLRRQITDAAAVLESALREGADAGVIEETLQELGQVLKAVEVSETA